MFHISSVCLYLHECRGRLGDATKECLPEGTYKKSSLQGHLSLGSRGRLGDGGCVYIEKVYVGSLPCVTVLLISPSRLLKKPILFFSYHSSPYDLIKVSGITPSITIRYYLRVIAFPPLNQRLKAPGAEDLALTGLWWVRWFNIFTISSF